MPVFNFLERFWAGLDFEGSPEDAQNDKISFLEGPRSSRGSRQLDAWTGDTFQSRFWVAFGYISSCAWNPMALLFVFSRLMFGTRCNVSLAQPWRPLVAL